MFNRPLTHGIPDSPQLQPEFPVDPPGLFVIDLPSFPPQQDVDAAVAIAHPRRRQFLDPHLETGLIGTAGLVSDGRPLRRQRIAGPPLADTVAGLQIANQLTGPIRP